MSSDTSELITVAYGTIHDRKITRRQGKNKTTVAKLHKPLCGNAARIKLCWTQPKIKIHPTTDAEEEPPLKSYVTVSEKEKIILAHAENFRLRVNAAYPNRPPLLLAPKNENGVQKLICSFVRPSPQPYPEMGDWRGVASFVADHFRLTPLPEPTHLDPPGSRSASLEHTPSSRRQFVSQYLHSMEEEQRRQVEEARQVDLELERVRTEELERPPPDPLEGRRVHCWVAVLPGRGGVETPFYLEGSSGLRFELQDCAHLSVEAVWDHTNLWVNLHTPHITPQFDLEDLTCWLPLLNEKNSRLDMPQSWMKKIKISLEAYQRRYPGGCKTEWYKRTKHELCAPLSREDGLVSKITRFSDLEYRDPVCELSEFRHRKDRLRSSRRDIQTGRVIDSYAEGRPDHVKEHEYYETEGDQRRLTFFDSSHPEGLSSVHVTRGSVREEFCKHRELLRCREMSFDQEDRVEVTVEELLPLPEGCEEKTRLQVSQRKFFHAEGKVMVRFHLLPGHITAGYLHFLKPTGEAKFGVEHLHEYEPISQAEEGQETRDIEIKKLMESQIQYEKDIMTHAAGIHREIGNVLAKLKRDHKTPGLKTSVFDQRRNQDVVLRMLQKEREGRERALRELVEPVDRAAPLLARRGAAVSELDPSEHQTLSRECKEDLRSSTQRAAESLKNKIAKLQEELFETQSKKSSAIPSDQQGTQNDIILRIEALQFRLERLLFFNK